MKLSYREKIGLLVLIVALVLIIFIVGPIKHFRANIEKHDKQKAEVQVEYDKVTQKIAQIPTIESNINKIYEESKGLSDIFFEHKENIDFDKYFEELLNKEPYKKSPKNALEITGGLTVLDAGTSEIPFYYYKPSVITYPILAAADTNGDLLKTKDEALYNKLQEAMTVSELKSQKVEHRTAIVPMRFTKEALLALEDELKENETGVRITSVVIGDYSFGEASQIPELKGYSNGTVSFSFYTMQQIQKPEFKD